MKVLMIGPARNVNGGISAVVNNYYKAGIDKKVHLEYLGTMEDGNKLHKGKIAIKAFFLFLYKVSGVDVIHIHMASDTSLYRKLPFICLAKLAGKKVILHQHGGNIEYFYYSQCGPKRQKFIRKILQKADRFIVVAPYLKDIFKDIVEENKIIVLPNAIHVPEDFIKEYKEQNILFLGRLCKEKGIYELLDAVSNLKKEFPNLNLYLGGVWVEDELKLKAEKSGDYIHYLGWIDKEKKDEYLRKCNIFVLPTYFEGLPMSLLEAMAYRCACVASEVGGIPQVITQGRDGILVRPKDRMSLQENLRGLLENPSLQKFL